MAKIILLYLILINIVTFWVYADDKRRARHSSFRTSEFSLVMLAVMGGSLGAMLAMLLLRHKTRHKSFVLGIPTILIVQLLLVYLLLH